jgi:hypothetical protein
MAGNLAAVNNYMRDVLIIPQGVRDALNGHGLESFDDFRSLTAKDITAICSYIRKPGGTIPNPNAQVPGQPAEIPNPGVPVGHVHELRLEMLRYFVFHSYRIQRPCNAQFMTLARLQAIYKLEKEDKPKDTDKLPLPKAITKAEEIRTNLEDLDDYLLRKRGENGLPLAYVVRAEVDLPDPGDDPGFGMPDYLQEMVRRGEHGTIAYNNDNREVWNVIRHITHGGLAWSWVSGFARTLDGRAAYLALKAHYLGTSYRSRIQAACDTTISKTYFDGNRNFTFENYTTTLQKAFTDLELCGEPLSESKKVQILLANIHSAALQPAKGTVSAMPTLNENFDLAVNFLAEQNDKLKAMTATRRNISSVGTSTNRPGKGGQQNNKGKGAKKGAPKKKTKYYSPKEWWALTNEQRDKIREDRKKNRMRKVSFASTTTEMPSTDNKSNDSKDRTVSVLVSRRQRSDSAS